MAEALTHGAGSASLAMKRGERSSVVCQVSVDGQRSGHKNKQIQRGEYGTRFLTQAETYMKISLRIGEVIRGEDERGIQRAAGSAMGQNSGNNIKRRHETHERNTAAQTGALSMLFKA